MCLFAQYKNRNRKCVQPERQVTLQEQKHTFTTDVQPEQKSRKDEALAADQEAVY